MIVKLDIVKNPYLILDSTTLENDVKTLFTNSVFTEIQELYPTATAHRSNALLKGVTAVRKVGNLAAIPPVIEDPTVSPSQNEVQAINAMWASARIELVIYQGYPGNVWVYKGSASLTNQAPFPFVQDDLLGYWTNNLAFDFEHGAKIGFALKTNGAGLLTGDNNVQITADLVCKCDIVIP